MLKKRITYEDFNGEETSEDHFFHLSKAELVELEMSHDGGMSAALERIVASKDGKAIITEFKKIILGSYGKKSADGKRFIKTQELRDEFESSEAYSTLFMELVTDTDASVIFINGIVPAGMIEEAIKITKTNLAAVETPVEEIEPRIVTRAEMVAMSSDDIVQLNSDVAAGKAKIDI